MLTHEESLGQIYKCERECIEELINAENSVQKKQSIFGVDTTTGEVVSHALFGDMKDSVGIDPDPTHVRTWASTEPEKEVRRRAEVNRPELFRDDLKIAKAGLFLTLPEHRSKGISELTAEAADYATKV